MDSTSPVSALLFLPDLPTPVMNMSSSDAKVNPARIAAVSTLDLVRKEQGPTIHSRLTIEQLAYLRALASGISKSDALSRYFPGRSGAERQEQALSAASIARALARKHADSSAHLIGLDVWAATKTKTPKGAGLTSKYDRDAFFEYLQGVDPGLASSLEEFDEEDIYAKYLEFFPQEGPLSATSDALEDRKESRRTRLVARHVDAIKRIEKLVIGAPSPLDDVGEWLPESWVPILRTAGIKTLDDLGRVVSLGGRWYLDIPGLKPGIAAKLQRSLDRLLPDRYRPAVPVTMNDVLGLAAPPVAVHEPQDDPQLAVVEKRPSLFTATSPAGHRADSTIEATNDVEALKEWANAVTNSEATIKSYEREGGRFLAWLAVERDGKQLINLSSRDCTAYLAFLQNIPDRYISRQRFTGDQAGGLIFRGQLTDASVAQARTIVSSMCEWLFAGGYMPRNPWRGLHKKIARARVVSARNSKSLNNDWLQKALDHLAKEPFSPAKERMVFLLEFTTRTGLRPIEIVKAKVSDIQRTDDGLFMRVIGKGEKERWCFINHAAEGALRKYLRDRDLPPLESCGKDTPLVSSTQNSANRVGYQALHESFSAWMKYLSGVLGEPPLTSGAPTLHKLRHTFATTAVKEGVPYDVIQAQLGHENINTTISSYATAPDARRAEEINKMS